MGSEDDAIHTTTAYPLVMTYMIAMNSLTMWETFLYDEVTFS